MHNTFEQLTKSEEQLKHEILADFAELFYNAVKELDPEVRKKIVETETLKCDI